MIKKWRDYKRRKEIDKQARELWIDAFTTGLYKDRKADECIAWAHSTVASFYDAFYPNHKS